MSGAHHSVEYLKELYAELHRAEHVRHIKYIVMMCTISAANRRKRDSRCGATGKFYGLEGKERAAPLREAGCGVGRRRATSPSASETQTPRTQTEDGTVSSVGDFLVVVCIPAGSLFTRRSLPPNAEAAGVDVWIGFLLLSSRLRITIHNRGVKLDRRLRPGPVAICLPLACL